MSIIFVLNLDADTPRGSLPTTVNPDFGCPPNWRLWDGHCYFINTAQVEYNDARALCTSQGADLASIKNENENNFIMSYMYDGK